MPFYLVTPDLRHSSLQVLVMQLIGPVMQALFILHWGYLVLQKRPLGQKDIGTRYRAFKVSSRAVLGNSFESQEISVAELGLDSGSSWEIAG